MLKRFHDSRTSFSVAATAAGILICIKWCDTEESSVTFLSAKTSALTPATQSQEASQRRRDILTLQLLAQTVSFSFFRELKAFSRVSLRKRNERRRWRRGRCFEPADSLFLPIKNVHTRGEKEMCKWITGESKRRKERERMTEACERMRIGEWNSVLQDKRLFSQTVIRTVCVFPLPDSCLLLLMLIWRREKRKVSFHHPSESWELLFAVHWLIRFWLQKRQQKKLHSRESYEDAAGERALISQVN